MSAFQVDFRFALAGLATCRSGGSAFSANGEKDDDSNESEDDDTSDNASCNGSYRSFLNIIVHVAAASFCRVRNRVPKEAKPVKKSVSSRTVDAGKQLPGACLTPEERKKQKGWERQRDETYVKKSTLRSCEPETDDLRTMMV